MQVNKTKTYHLDLCSIYTDYVQRRRGRGGSILVGDDGGVVGEPI